MKFETNLHLCFSAFLIHIKPQVTLKKPENTVPNG